MDEFREGLTENEKTTFDNFTLQGCDRESIETFLEDYGAGFDEAWEEFLIANPHMRRNNQEESEETEEEISTEEEEIEEMVEENEEELEEEELEEEETPPEEVNLSSEYPSMSGLPDDRRDDEETKDKGAPGEYPEDLEEIYPTMKKKEPDESLEGIDREFETMKDLPPDKEE